MKKIALVHWTLVLLFLALLCFAGIGITAAAATDKDDKAPAPSTDPAVIEAVKKVEREMGDAMVAVDIGKLDEIFADEWATIGSSGRVITKEKVLQDFKSGKDKLVSYELGPMDVQVFGDVAVAHAGVTEKRIREGKDDSGESVWMDLLEKRAGKWVVVRSASASVK
jgi:Na+-transporting methylmalonyl-CoA/oxaloacetate decarboxylase gamma subunit